MIKAEIANYKKRVNPKIARDISDIIKPYWKLIDNSSDYYKLRTLAFDIRRINIKVKKDVELLLGAFQKAAWQKIEGKIKRIEGTGKDKDFNSKNIKEFLDKHNIDGSYYRILLNAINENILINLCLEDFKLITNKIKKAKCSTFEIGSLVNNDIDRLMRPRLKGMKNAILILTGNNQTTLDELDFVWQSALKYLPKNGKTAFAYKIDDVNRLQLNLMAVK